MVAASGTVILVNGAAQSSGCSWFRPRCSRRGRALYFGSIAAMHVALAAFAVWRRNVRTLVPAEDKTRFVGAPPQAADRAACAPAAAAGGPGAPK
jgi:hypothetical protein